MSQTVRTSPRPDAGGHPSAAEDAAGDAGGLRERKKKMTRRAIHEAALRLVVEHGLDAVTTDAIAAAADVSPRTFFNYFPTKDAAVLGVPPDLADGLEAELDSRPADEDPFTALTTVVQAWFVRIEGDPLRQLRRTVVGRDPRLAAAMMGTNRELETALARAAVRRRGAADELSARVMVAAVIGAARAAYLHVQAGADAGDQDRPFADALDDSFALLARGLTTS